MALMKKVERRQISTAINFKKTTLDTHRQTDFGSDEETPQSTTRPKT
jgi:hypothetical protein